MRDLQGRLLCLERMACMRTPLVPALGCGFILLTLLLLFWQVEGAVKRAPLEERKKRKQDSAAEPAVADDTAPQQEQQQQQPAAKKPRQAKPARQPDAAAVAAAEGKHKWLRAVAVGGLTAEALPAALAMAKAAGEVRCWVGWRGLGWYVITMGSWTRFEHKSFVCSCCPVGLSQPLQCWLCRPAQPLPAFTSPPPPLPYHPHRWRRWCSRCPTSWPPSSC